MIGRAKRDLNDFRHGEPGRRFEDRYRRRQEEGHGWRDPCRLFNVGVGTVLVVGSALFGWAPGPGTLTFLLGLALIAGELRPAARFLDRAEVWTRKFLSFVTKTWRSSAAGKAAVVGVAAALAAAILYTAYRLFFAG